MLLGQCQSTRMNTPSSPLNRPSGPPGDPGPPGIDYIHLPAIGVSSPQSVEKIEVIKLQWDYIAGSECMRRVEIWQHNHLLASREYSIGLAGPPGPA